MPASTRRTVGSGARPLVAALLLGAALAACRDGSPASPTAPALRTGAAHASRRSAISALTWNMYVGTDVDGALIVLGALPPDATPTEIAQALGPTLQVLAATDYRARVGAILDQIARHRPELVGLQEVSTIDLRAVGMPEVIDFRAALEEGLAERGLHYRVAAAGDGVDVSLLGGAITLADHDLLLVDDDRVTVADASGHAFAAQFADVVPPGTLPDGVNLVRGWAQARVTVDHLDYAVAVTHPESDLATAGGTVSMDGLRSAQLTELLAALPPDLPAVVMGDLNGLPDSGMYGVLGDAGFADVWRELRPGADGFTCCQEPDLSNKTAAFDHRIDYVFVRGLGREGPGLQGEIDRLGEVPADRVAGPAYRIWPSDHAGLATTLLSTPAAGS